MKCIARLAAGLVLAVSLHGAAAPAVAQESAARIAWAADLPAAMATAKEKDQVLMVCINAKHVDGREVEEPAAKGLREIVYRDRRVVERSRDFVCVLLTADGSSAEYDALRTLGIEGRIISPQHVFVNPEGDRILLRREYWRHGSGDPAVEALLRLMDEAQAAAGKAAAAAGAEPVPEGEGRAEWIARMLAQVNAGVEARDAALDALVRADKDGDCTGPLIALLAEHEKDKEISTLRALVRVLGRDGLEAAALPLTELLRHKEDSIRANAAVSLEYIGSRDKKVISALTKMADKEKDEAIANHAYRALGRIGTEDAKVRSLLLKQAATAKSEFASYGACIGLAYFEGDEKAMRGVEEILKVLGVPGSRRGGGQNSVKRGLVSWTLAYIGDAESGKFVREELIAPLENVKAFWVDGLRGFWTLVAEVCEGEKERIGEVEAGVRVFVSFAKGANLERYGAETGHLMDEARRGRDTTGFVPRGDGVLGEDE